MFRDPIFLDHVLGSNLPSGNLNNTSDLVALDGMSRAGVEIVTVRSDCFGCFPLRTNVRRDEGRLRAV